MYPFIWGDRSQIDKEFDLIDQQVSKTLFPQNHSSTTTKNRSGKRNISKENVAKLIGALLGRAPKVSLNLEQILFYGPEHWACLYQKDPQLTVLLRDLVSSANRLAGASHKIVQKTLDKKRGECDRH